MTIPRRSPSPAVPAMPAPRAALAALHAYSADVAPCAIDLSDNTNLFGAPPTATQIVRDVDATVITRYPSPDAADLRRVLAAHHGVAPECVVTGCGSDGVLDAAIRAFSEPGQRFAWHDPTFSMIPILAHVNGLEPAALPCPGAPDAAVVRRLFDTGARVVYLCTPNNPTGAAMPAAAFEAARERLRASARPPLLVLDQAYAEFEEPDGVPRRHFGVDEPVLVTRTLSKAYGLAGLRIGYGIGPAAIVHAIEKVRGPFVVGGLSERAAVAALTLDREWVQARVVEACALRARFVAALVTMGLAPSPSAANFVLVPVASAAASSAALHRAGVAVRGFAALPGIGDALRITIGPWPMLEACLAALQESLP